MIRLAAIAFLVIAAALPAPAGPYSGPAGGPAEAPDAAIPGFVGSDGDGWATPNNYLNPVFVGWASGYVDYVPAPSASVIWRKPERALGPVTGDHYNSVVSLGDLTAAEIAQGADPGRITLTFSWPIYDGPGADFAVFENAFAIDFSEQIMAELAYVEVSSNGADFARFPSRSLTPMPDPDDWAYAEIDVTNVYNLAGKHINADGRSWGTPFDLSCLAGDPLVRSGLVDINEIRYVRLVDVPGNGSFADSAGSPIYDAWLTYGSGGFDLEALGVINQLLPGDTNLDRAVNLDDLVRLSNNWGRPAGWAGGDFNGDGVVDAADLAVLSANWGRQDGLQAPIAPEPASGLLSAAGTCLLCLRRRRRR